MAQSVATPKNNSQSSRTRDEESRAYDERSVPERPALVWDQGSVFNPPPGVLARKPYHRLCWVALAQRNEPDRKNYREYIDRGFSPVRASEHPEYSRHYDMSVFDGMESSKERHSDVVENNNNMILMEQNISDFEAYQEHLRKQVENHEMTKATAIKDTSLLHVSPDMRGVLKYKGMKPSMPYGQYGKPLEDKAYTLTH